MPEQTTEAALVELFKQRSGVPFVPLLKLEHPDWASPYRFVHNTESVTHGGEIYDPRPMKISLPSDKDKGASDINVNIDMTGATSLDIANFRGIVTFPTATLSIVMFTDQNTAQWGPWRYEVRNRELSATTINLRLSKYFAEKQKFPKDLISAVNVPGIFKGTNYARSV